SIQTRDIRNACARLEESGGSMVSAQIWGLSAPLRSFLAAFYRVVLSGAWTSVATASLNSPRTLWCPAMSGAAARGTPLALSWRNASPGPNPPVSSNGPTPPEGGPDESGQ